MGSGFPWLDWQIRRAETGGQRFSFSFPCLGRIPLPPFPNNFHEGSFTFLGETVRFVHVLAGFFGQNWGLRGAFWSRAGLLAGARELSAGSEPFSRLSFPDNSLGVVAYLQAPAS